mmetsp:Transcript_80799/g.187583  ORF Transcript_80799/g.187583 Transcript_80799/m.187583 type:complete len:173 (+) Transcript_80799:147-665(+)
MLSVQDLQLLYAIASELVASLEKARTSLEVSNAVTPLSPRLDGHPRLSEPVMVLDVGDRVVIDKPDGWEVDNDAPSGEHGMGGKPHSLLSSFVRAMLLPRCCPVLMSSEHDHGFVHRLDVPTSGLILAAKTHAALRDLGLQLNVGTLIRDYNILVLACPHRSALKASCQSQG